MRFGPVPLTKAKGAILAHSVALPEGRLRKGCTLAAADLVRLAQAGVSEVMVARLDPGDVAEDRAAALLARALVPDAAMRIVTTGTISSAKRPPSCAAIARWWLSYA